MPTRVQDAVSKLFRAQAEPDISVYLINTDDDLRRVVLGMNAGRDSLKEAVPLVAFLPTEFESVGIQVTQTPGNLPCDYANKLHHDLVATDTQLVQLCERAMRSGRVSGNCSKGSMNDIIERATREKCRTVTKEGNCQVTAC
jgi:hypothetical protein